MSILVVDAGASNLRFGLATEKKVQHLETVVTPEDWPSARTLIATQAIEHQTTGIVLGLPGTLDSDGATLVRAPNLLNWIGQPILRDLKKATHQPVFLENDATLNALGEAVYGAGKRDRVVGFLTISSGVNGARIVDGVPDIGAFSFELGLLSVHGVAIESLVSGRGLERVHGVTPNELPQTSWQAVERSLTSALLSILILWRPEIMILGGPMVREKNIDLKRMNALLKQRWQHPATAPKLVAGILDDYSGLWGGLAYAHLHLEQLFGTVSKRL